MRVNSSASFWLCALSILSIPTLSANAQERGVQGPDFSKLFQPDTIGPGSVSTLEFLITNNDPQPVTDLAFSDTLPEGVTIATAAVASTSCPDGVLSAPDGGSTITLTGGRVGAQTSCGVTVQVTSSTPGTHVNTSEVLTSSAGTGDVATDDLFVDTTLPGFSKSFAPPAVSLGGRSTLTFTIDNAANAAGVLNLDFVDSFPNGLVIASPANAATTCGTAVLPPTLTATPGSDSVTLDANGVGAFPAVAAGATCTVTVEVVPYNAARLENLSGELLANFVFSGRAAAALDVTADPVHLSKEFLDDPVAPGGSVWLEFTVSNFSRLDSATSIDFTDDLGATLAGLAVTGSLPTAPCGAGSVVSGTGVLSFTGGSLPPEGSCTFAVELAVPAEATPGTYTNTTSALGYEQGGDSGVSSPGSDNLHVSPAPLLSKTFLDSPVSPGDTSTMEFTITNTSTTSGATEITFKDELTTFLPFPVSVTLPPTPNPPCGAGSSLALVSMGIDGQGLELSGGSLAAAPGAGSTCTFTVDLTLPTTMPPGRYDDFTEVITATVDGATRTGNPATATLEVIAAPDLRKSFTDDPVAPGGAVTLEFTLVHSPDSLADATDVEFTDDLAALVPALAGLVATDLPKNDICGAGSTLSASAGDTLLTFQGGTLAPGDSCTFTAILAVPAGAAVGSFTNTTSGVSAMVDGIATSSAPAEDDLDVSPLVFTKQFLTNPAIAGESTTLRFTIENLHPTSDAVITLFTDNLAAELAGLAATGPPSLNECGGSLSGTTFLFYIGGSVLAGTQCSIEVDVLVPLGAADGSYTNITSSLVTDLGTVAPAIDTLTVSSTLLTLTKEFKTNPSSPGTPVDLEFTLSNLDATRAATGIAFTDDLGAALTGLVATGLPTAACGGTVSGTSTVDFTGGSVSAASSCSFTVTLSIPAAPAVTLAENVTSSVTGTIGGFAVTGDPATDTLLLRNLDFTKTFDGPTVTGSTAVLSFTLTNLSGAETASNLAFNDDLDAVLTDLVAVGLPLADPCGVGSQLAGTSFLTFTGGELLPSANCTFEVTVQLPAGVSPGDYVNTTSDLFSLGLSVAGSATATLTVEPPPIFTKAFAPDTVPGGGTSTLTFTVDNTASSLAASALDFTDNLPAGIFVATPANAATTCVGGTLTAAAATGTISYTGGTVPAGGSCTLSIDVTSNIPGVFVNTTGDLTSSSGNSGTATATLTVQDDQAPEVTEITTPAGPLTPCDSVRDPITYIGVTIEDDVSAIQNAGNPGSYLLVGAGPDGDFSTISCGRAASGDDVAVVIDSVSLTSLDPRIVDAQLGFSGLGLGAELYRLFVCDTITDGAGNPLDGDDSGSPGGDFEIFFRADPFNLFENGHFDDCPASLDPWIDVATPPNTIMTGSTGTDDGSGSPLSTSALIDHSVDGASALAQCVALNAGLNYVFDARLRFETAMGSLASVTSSCEFYDGASCSGASLGSSSQTTLVEDNGSQWFDSQSKVVPPQGALSALCDLAAEGFGADPTFTLFVDDLVLSAPAQIFADGFESGDTGAWSSEVP